MSGGSYTPQTGLIEAAAEGWHRRFFLDFLGGVFIIEAAFGLPGIGQQAINAIGQLDIPMILGTVLFTALLIVVSNLVVDIAIGLVDPRIRYD